MSGVNNFSEEGGGNFYHVVFAEEKLTSLPKKTVVPSEKVTPSDDVEKITNILNDMEYPVHMIRRKDLDNFQKRHEGR